MVGFGKCHYKNESCRSGGVFITGFSPLKQNTAIYILAGFHPFSFLLVHLEKFTRGKNCVYIKRLADVNLIELEDFNKMLTDG